MTTEWNFRPVVNHTPIKNIVFYSMAQLHKLSSQMFCWNCQTHTCLKTMTFNVLLTHSVVLIIIKMSNGHKWVQIVEVSQSLLIERLNNYGKVFSFALLFDVHIICLKNFVNFLQENQVPWEGFQILSFSFYLNKQTWIVSFFLCCFQL